MTANSWSLGYTSAFFDLSSPGILFQWQKLYARDGIPSQTTEKSRSVMTNNSSSSKPVEQMTEEELREGFKASHGLRHILKATGLPKSIYYYHRTTCKQPCASNDLRVKIRDIFHTYKTIWL
ncbi:hypothetical protein JYT73_00175 [Pseudoalteromonas haloplanktis]|nr:hypothetical protein [Pseudoalteromonas haloplanktis]